MNTISRNYLWCEMVNLTTTQVETFFGELEYLEPRLEALGVAVDEEEGWHSGLPTLELELHYACYQCAWYEKLL